MYATKTFDGGVKVRTVEGGIVQHPVTLTIDGAEIELTLEDAKKLQQGLDKAIAHAVQAEEAALGDGTKHCFVLGPTRYGMSPVPSKLPQ